MSKQKPKGYWKNKGNVMREVEEIRRGNSGVLPSKTDLRKNHSSLCMAIERYHGGFSQLRVELGEEPKLKPSGYWDNRENVVAEAKRAMDKMGADILPSHEDLINEGYTSLSAAIVRNFGYAQLRKEFGQEELKKPDGYWQNRSNVLAEINNLMDEGGFESLPSYSELFKLGRIDIIQAIKNYHGGFSEFRESIGEKVFRKANNFWKDEKKVLAELERIKSEHELTEYPNYDQILEWGSAGLTNGIDRYHGGLTSFLRSVGKDNGKPKRGEWKDENYVFRRAEEIMEKEGWEYLPASHLLQKLGYSSLTLAIIKYHGGFPVFREKLNEYLGRDPEKSILETYVGGENE